MDNARFSSSFGPKVLYVDGNLVSWLFLHTTLTNISQMKRGQATLSKIGNFTIKAHIPNYVLDDLSIGLDFISFYERAHGHTAHGRR